MIYVALAFVGVIGGAMTVYAAKHRDYGMGMVFFAMTLLALLGALEGAKP